jgi:hypothetical protein
MVTEWPNAVRPERRAADGQIGRKRALESPETAILERGNVCSESFVLKLLRFVFLTFFEECVP